MTILQKLRPSGAHAGKRWSQLGDAGVAVRHTDVWEHETFAEEQARWERTDPEYARLCEEVRQAQRARSNDSPAPGIMPEPVRIHDEPGERTAPPGDRQAARLRVRGPATRNPVSNEPTKLEVE